MKKITLSLFLFLAFLTPVRADTCKPETAPEPIEFSEKVLDLPGSNFDIYATYQWQERSEGYWQLFLDINPIGGKETWVSEYPGNWKLKKPVDLPQTHDEVVCPSEPTPPTPLTKNYSRNYSTAYAVTCSDTKPSGIAHAAVTRLNSESALVQWTIHSGNQTHIIYGESGTGWHHAALNVGIAGNFTVYGLVEGRTYDWQVIPMNGCMAGDRSPVVTNL